MTTGTRSLYEKEVNCFLKWTAGRGGRHTVAAEVDAELVHFMNEVYLAGHAPARGEKLLACICFVAPRWGRLGDLKMPRAWIALKGWHKKCPSRSRRPFPWEVWAAIAWLMILRGQWQMGMMTVLMVCAYLRPGECLTIRRGDLVRPTASTGAFWSLLLFPEERPERSKVGAKDDSLLLDTRWCLWLNQVAAALKEGDQNEPIFPFRYPEYVRELQHAKGLLQIKDLVPYCGRHSGPSVDRAKGLGSLDEIARRGRWAAVSSVQCYERHARLSHTEGLMTA